MQNAEHLLHTLRERGVKIWSEDGQIRFQAPRGVLLPEELSSIRAFKPDILVLLARPGALADIPLRPRPSGCAVPMTAMQTRFWRYSRDRQDGLSKRATAVGARIEGPLDTGLLRQCIDAVAMRHEALRTTVAVVDGVPLQRIGASHGHSMEVEDVAGTSPAELDVELQRLGQGLVARDVPVATGPMFRTSLLKVSAHEHVLVLAIDHFITDALSNEIICNELWTLYAKGLTGAPLSLPGPDLQFGDYAVWQAQTRPIWVEQHFPYWQERLKGLRPTELPTDSWLPKLENPGAVFKASLGEALSIELRKISKREGVPLSFVLFTVHVAVLSRWAGLRDVVVATTSHARHRTELENVVGWLANHLHLRIEVEPGDTLSDLLRKVSAEFYNALRHDDFDRVPDLIPEWLVDPVAYFNWLPGEWQRRPLAAESLPFRISGFGLKGAPPFKFRPFFFDTPSGVQIAVGYRRDLFSLATLERFASHLRRFAQTFTLNPQAKIGALKYIG